MGKSLGHLVLGISAILVPLLLSACGGDTTVTASEASRECVYCHGWNEKKLSPVTGEPITEEWAKSTHNSANGAGCRDCHGYVHNHPGNCTGCHHGGKVASGGCGQCHGTGSPVVIQPVLDRFKNPDVTGRCSACHGNGTGKKPLDLAGPQHYFRDSSVASYMFTNYSAITGTTSLCARCHNPHDPSSRIAINRAYAKSGHGDVNGVAWRGLLGTADADLKRVTCIAYCHSTTGYLNFVRKNATPQTVQPVPWSPTDYTKEVLACIACHQDYSWKLRSVAPQVSNFKSQGDGNGIITFPDVGTSNLCIVCHAGRTAGGNVETLADDSFTNQGFKHTHYMAAAGIMYGKVGYEFYTSHAAYVSGSFRHDQIGTSAYPATGSRGPCVGCHMNSGSHSLKAFDPQTGYVSPACGVCHSTPRTNPAGFIEEMETEKIRYQAALAELKNLLQVRNGYYFYPESPYMYTTPFDHEYTETGTCSKNLPVRNWMTGGTFTYAWNGTNCTSAGSVGITGTATTPNTNSRVGLATNPTGKFNSYAASNWKALYSEPGGWAHRRRYAKRLIYDSIDWVDDNQFNYSVGQTLSANGTVITDAVRYLIPVVTRGGTDYRNLTGTGDPLQRP